MTKYERWYNQIIARARLRKLSGYGERHHIVPRALGGGNEASNIVKLTAREHFLVHWFLIKIVTGDVAKRKMLHALFRMSAGRTVSSWQYAVARQALHLALSGRVLSVATRAKMSAIRKTPEHCAAISASKKGVPPSALQRISLAKAQEARRGGTNSPQHRAAIAACGKYRTRGKPLSVEHKSKIRDSMLAFRAREKLTNG